MKTKLTKLAVLLLVPTVLTTSGIMIARKNAADFPKQLYKTTTINDLLKPVTDIPEKIVAGEEATEAPVTTVKETLKEADKTIESATKIASRGASMRAYYESDVELVARTVYGEAHGEPYEGKIAVANVMVNRVEHNKKTGRSFAPTIKGLLTPNQFNCVKDPKFYTRQIPSEYYAIARRALSKSEIAVPDGVLYFYNPKIATDSWIKTRKVFKQIGDHLFCY